MFDSLVVKDTTVIHETWPWHLQGRPFHCLIDKVVCIFLIVKTLTPNQVCYPNIGHLVVWRRQKPYFKVTTKKSCGQIYRQEKNPYFITGTEKSALCEIKFCWSCWQPGLAHLSSTFFAGRVKWLACAQGLWIIPVAFWKCMKRKKVNENNWFHALE